MEVQCHPISTAPGTTALLRAFLEPAVADTASLRRWYGSEPFGFGWAKSAPELSSEHRDKLAALLLDQAERFGAGDAARENIEHLRNGAAAVVTGQQVALFGGPLLTILKAATAIRKAQDASAVTGRKYVPVFWLASEDHDLAEVDQISLLTKTELETLKLGLDPARPVPVGSLRVDGDTEAGWAKLDAAIERASELIGWGPVSDLLRECYAQPGTTLAQGYGRLISAVFAEFGLVVLDASSRGFHELGAPVFRAAIEHAGALETALLERSEELTARGYHAQVLVSPGHSLLFLLDAETGARQPLRRIENDAWKAGGQTYSTEELLAILESSPERLSPNALLRPVFQDAILPTAAYIG
ncbi:MAG TPA: bacillithiol biosynthesis BshC, partial [Bryocella sp.]|nr:bacillithiol biosynthesis BshC [Bryocella sp.]